MTSKPLEAVRNDHDIKRVVSSKFLIDLLHPNNLNLLALRKNLDSVTFKKKKVWGKENENVTCLIYFDTARINELYSL